MDAHSFWQSPMYIEVTYIKCDNCETKVKVDNNRIVPKDWLPCGGFYSHGMNHLCPACKDNPPDWFPLD